MRKLTPREKSLALIAVAIVAIGLNAVTFLWALPAMNQTDTYQTVQTIPPFISLQSSFNSSQTPYLARDFSAYYIAAWKLVNAPARVYNSAVSQEDYRILPRPASYKYAPAFLLFVLPLLPLGYQSALVAFNVIQLALLPLMGLLAYRIIRDRNLALGFAVLVIVLIQPLPPTYSPLLFRFQSLQPYSISWSYFYEWVNANAKVLQTFLLLASLYFGKMRRPIASAAFIALGTYDPRFALLAIPLLIYYNLKSLKLFGFASLALVLLLNAFSLYQGIWLQFFGDAFTNGMSTPLYPYAWIPLYGMVSISLVEFGSIGLRRMREKRIHLQEREARVAEVKMEP